MNFLTKEELVLPEPNKAVWVHDQVQLLIELYKKLRPELKCCQELSTKQKLWKLIELEMKRRGHWFTAAQVENKWKSLERGVKKCLKYEKTPKRPRLAHPYAKELLEVMQEEGTDVTEYLSDASSQDKTENPQCLLDSNGSGKELATDDIVFTENNVDEYIPLSEATQQTDKTTPTNITKIDRKKERILIKQMSSLVKVKAEKNKQIGELIKLEAAKLEAFRERTEILKKRNQLLEKFLSKHL